MRIIFLLLSCLFVFESIAEDITKDSIYFEKVRNEVIELKRKGNLIESLEKLEIAIAESKLANLSERFINERLRIILANRYSNMGDFDRAMELAKNLESYFKQIGDLEHELEIKNNLGVYNINIGRYSIAYDYYLEGWQEKNPINEIDDKLDWLDGLSASCIELGKLKEAEMFLTEAENLLNIYSFEDKEELLLYYYINKSNYALAIANDAQAEEYLIKCIRLTEKLGIRKGAYAYQLFVTLSLKQGKYEQALDYTERILELRGAHENAFVKDPYLFQCYSLQAKAYLALKKYKEAVVSCQEAENQAIYFQRKYMFNESKLHIGELRRKNLETSIMALYAQYKQSGRLEYLQQALVYANRAKSNVLNERWANSKMLSLDNRKEAIDLRFKLIFRLNKLENEEGNAEVIALRNTLDSLNTILGVKKENPFLIDDLIAFQSRMKKESICFQYIKIDTLLFRFDIQKNTIGWSAEDLKNPEAIFDFYSTLRSPESTAQEFLLTSSKLPVLLPFQLLKDSSINEISIIPDGVLNYIIFDAIPSNIGNGGWKSIRYLAEEYCFSYQFSIQSSENQTKREIGDYIGFAPDYSNSKKWATLKNSEQALEQAQGYFGGKSYFGPSATRKKLQELSSNADILQLYAHGVSNDSSYDASYLILQDGRIYVDEVLTLPLKARLCLLTACEVGLGKEYKGEGITSIAWAFKAAGVENVIQSMWKLNEQSSYQLMSYFYNHQEKGISSAEALNEAKRQYLNNSEISERLKHPYYWAGIGHYGKGALFLEKALQWWEIILGFVAALGACLAIWKYTQKNKVVS